MTALQFLRLFAAAEAVTLLLLLLVAVPLKHAGGLPIATAIMGPVHGLAFLAFLWLLLRAHAAGLLTRGETGRLFVGALIPFGGLVNQRLLARRGTPS